MLIPYADDNPTLRVPYVTLGIIAVNVLVFAYQISLPEEAAYEFVRAFAFVPGELYGFLPPGPARHAPQVCQRQQHDHAGGKGRQVEFQGESMGEVVNLRRARKDKDRHEREASAASNRRLFGRTKAQKAAETKPQAKRIDRSRS